MPEPKSLGVIDHPDSDRKTDFLYRVSMKGLVRNARGEVLVVKETDRAFWDLPGGGMDHSEDLKSAIAREMKEEVNLDGDFSYRVIAVDEPVHLSAHNFWQIRLVFEITPANLVFSPGEDGDEVAFIDPQLLKDSDSETERKVYVYAMLANK